MLGLSRTKITAAGLANLKDLGKPRFLALGGNDLGDESIEHLAKLKSLRELSFVGTSKSTPAGREKLKAALPDCKIRVD